MSDPGGGSRDLSTRPLNIAIPSELKARLVAYCEESGLSQADVTRLALNQFLAKSGYPKGDR